MLNLKQRFDLSLLPKIGGNESFKQYITIKELPTYKRSQFWDGQEYQNDIEDDDEYEDDEYDEDESEDEFYAEQSRIESGYSETCRCVKDGW